MPLDKMDSASEPPQSAPVTTEAGTVLGGARCAVALVVVALFVPPIVGGLYLGLGYPQPEYLPRLHGVLMGTVLYSWLWAYSQRHQMSLVLDAGIFVLVAWLLVVPYYIIKCEGRQGLKRIALFCGVYGAAIATGIAVQVWARVAVVR